MSTNEVFEDFRNHLLKQDSSNVSLADIADILTAKTKKKLFKLLKNKQLMYLDEILEQSNTNSTRHKSKNGECHGELVLYKRNEINKEKVFKNWNKCIIRHGTTSTSKVANTVGQHGIIKNTLSVDKSIYEAGKKKEVKQEQFEIDAELQYEKDFKNGDLPIGITGNWEEDKEGYLKFFGKKEEAKNYFVILNEGEEISELKTLGEIRREEEQIIEDLERKEAVSVGVKENEGKIDYSEINLDILDLMASRFNANKHKYPKDNMKKQIDIKSLEWALFRHLKKMIQPIEGDKENYKDHISAILCNASMILDQIDMK